MHSSYAATDVESRGKTTSLSFAGVKERASERVKERKGEKNNHQEVEIEHLERVLYSSSSSTLDIHKNPGLVIIMIKKKSPCLNMNLL